jgi:tRNA-specific 2-thiouridylase
MKLVAALSGGVDSSVMAGLLKEAGHEVLGITLKLAPDREGPADVRRCCSVDDAMDARRVAAILGIPFYVFNAQELFARTVVDAFAAAYRAGLTPIPCVTCNTELKFGHLLERAQALGATLATGHYVRKVAGPHGAELHRPADLDRDQTYFLHAIGKAALTATEFPLGDMTKAEVRSHAGRLGLPVVDKPDSQDICFVPQTGAASLVEQWDGKGRQEGAFVDSTGRQMGQHQGVHTLTVGQRKGLNIASTQRLYVLQVDSGTGQALVGPQEELNSGGLLARDVSWLLDPGELENVLGDVVDVQIRARHTPAVARVERLADRRVMVFFDQPQFAVAPGQSAVFYRGSRCLGGGVIEAPLSAADPSRRAGFHSGKHGSQAA